MSTMDLADIIANRMKAREAIRWAVGTPVRVLTNEQTEDNDWYPTPGDEGVVDTSEDSDRCVRVKFNQGTFWLWNDDIEAIAQEPRP